MRSNNSYRIIFIVNCKPFSKTHSHKLGYENLFKCSPINKIMEFKERFIEAYKDITDIDKFLEYSVKPLRKSIRVNKLKISVKELKQRLESQRFHLTQIPWIK